MKSNLTKIFEIQKGQAENDRLEFCCGILLGMSLQDSFSSKQVKDIGIDSSITSHQQIATAIDHLVNLSEDSYQKERVKELVDLSLEIETISSLLEFQSYCDSIVLQRLLLPVLGIEDELTISLYEESMDDYQKVVKQKVHRLQMKIGSYLPKEKK